MLGAHRSNGRCESVAALNDDTPDGLEFTSARHHHTGCPKPLRLRNPPGKTTHRPQFAR